MKRYKRPIGTESVRDPSVIKRLVSKILVDKDSECWCWQGHKNRKGYGQIKMHGKAHWAHRVSYSTFIGPIPDGLSIHHTCHNAECVNPDHLTTVTVSENSKESNGSGIIDQDGNYIPV